ncbi:hypothetical protein [Sphingobacterium psychroaquaticum]|uniref:Uncharacterized protein n=1 Tax=Sphingobacterium psychroaquaticum TaxID=561061 RepID=A0A1X7K595_9SPHI|nr:hypothetical protein [Sphingobacterium psychroaquaticum]SMG35388.1 hypothetical protein SAMN05660862_2519 [Sphingobacterium psychroaquaticum]
MDANRTELHATETLLQRGVRVKARAPLWLRLLGKKTITLTLRAPTGGAFLRMGEWFLRCQLSVDQLQEISVQDALLFQVRYSRCIYRALACLFLVDRRLTKLFLRPYANYLREAITPKEALALLQLSILQGGSEDFMIITRFLRAKMITAPKKMGH